MTDWWTRRLGNQPTPPPRNTPPATPPVRNAIRFPEVPREQPQVEEQPIMADSNGQIDMGTAIRMWKGGEAQRRERMECPECGGGMVFSRAKGTAVNGHPPAPRCYTCGWNGKYTQADQASWIS